MFVDIHAHLEHEMFDPDIDDAISRAKAAGVSAIVANGVNPESNRKTLEIAKRHDIVKAACGVYPMDALARELEESSESKQKIEYDVDSEIEFIWKNADKITAIGECGLDYYNGEDKALQKKHFEQMIQLSEKLNKPLIVHSRKAEADAVEMIESSRLRKVLLHCFSGKKSLVKRGLDFGCYFSIPTNVVRAQHFWSIINLAPVSKLFCETDAPYLSPFRGKRNEPAFVIEAYKKVAELKGLELEECRKMIFNNYQRLFM